MVTINHSIKFILLALLTPTIAFAFFCPTNFQQINLGDTIDNVKQKCGTPTKEETKDIKKEGPQEWTYYIPQTVSTSGGRSEEQGTLKTQISFDASGKAINISVNGLGVGSTTICGPMIKLGTDRDQIKNACGDPSFINQQQQSAVTSPSSENQMTILTYDSNPPATLTFENGKLTQKQ